jgi:alkylhydroperoxidase family enzyme
MKAEFSDEEMVELTSVVGLFNFINRFNDALGVLPEA